MASLSCRWRELAAATEKAVKLSTKGRYAVMAMADLARHTGDGQNDHPVPLAEIARDHEEREAPLLMGM